MGLSRGLSTRRSLDAPTQPPNIHHHTTTTTSTSTSSSTSHLLQPTSTWPPLPQMPPSTIEHNNNNNNNSFALALTDTTTTQTSTQPPNPTYSKSRDPNGLILSLDANDTFRLEGFGTAVSRAQCDLWRHGKLCDVGLRVGDGEEVCVRASRVMLAAESLFFRAMFTTEEYKDAKEEVVTIREVDEEDLRKVVTALYTREIQVTDRTYHRLLSLSDRLHINTIRAACGLFLSRQLRPRNALALLHLADGYGLDELRRDAAAVARRTTFTTERIGETTASARLFTLSEKALAEVLSGDDLYVSSEDALLQCVLNWVAYDRDNRELALPKLLSQSIRLPHVSVYTLAEVTMSSPLFTSSLECMRLCNAAHVHRQLPASRYDLERAHRWWARYPAKNHLRRVVWVKQWSQRGEGFYTEPFDEGRWRLFICPKGNGRENAGHLSLFLDVANVDALPKWWHRHVHKFSITVVSWQDQQRSVTQEVSGITLHEGAEDWGFAKFMNLDYLWNLQHKFLLSDHLAFEVNIWDAEPASAGQSI